MLAGLCFTLWFTPTARAQVIELPASPHDIGSVAVNGTLVTSFVVGNAVGEPVLDISAVATQPKAGDDCTQFVIPAYSAVIAPGATDNVPVTFAPTAAGVHTCTLRFTSNDTVGGQDEVTLQGLALEAQISFTTPQNMGSATLGQTVNGIITIDNLVTATENLAVTAITANPVMTDDCNAFTIDTTGVLPLDIAPSASGTVQVDFIPTVVGVTTCTVDIVSNDLDTPTTSMVLEGTGTTPLIDVVTPQNIGVATLTQTVSGAITIGNLAGASESLVVSSITAAPIAGDECTAFAIDTTAVLPLTIPVNTTDIVAVDFTPTVVGTTTCTVDIVSNDPASPTTTLVIEGTGQAPQIVLPTDPHDLGTTVINTTLSGSFDIGNDVAATGALLLSAVTEDPQVGDDCGLFTLDTAGLPATLLPGDVATIPVDFLPIAGGTFGCTLAIASNDAGAPHSLRVIGTGQIPADINLDITAIDFGDQLLNTTTAATTVTISNVGDLPLLITDIMITGTHAADFMATPSQALMFTIMPGMSETVDVVFTPSALGARTAQLEISSDDINEPTVIVTLDGNGVEPDISVAPATLDFTQVTVGDTSAVQNVGIQNIGGWDLQVTGIALGGTNAADFGAVPTQTPTFTLAPNASATVAVTCAPTASGNLVATLDITSDDPDTAVSTVTLACTGMDPPQMSLSAASLDFGDVAVGATSAAMNFDIQNAMGMFRNDLNVSSIAVVTGDVADFAVDINTAIVGPGMAQPVMVTFTPQAMGTRSAVIRVTGDDPMTPTIDITVTGVGRQPNISVAPPSLNFGLIAIGVTSSALTVTATNSGNADLSITNVALTTNVEFAFTGNTTATVPAGMSETWDITCTPSAVGTFSDSLVITSDAANSPSVTVTLDCEGIDQALSTNPAPIVFPDTYVGDAAAPLPVNIINQTNNAVTVNSITVTDNVYTVTATTPFTLNNLGDSQVITLDFTPPANQPYPALLQLDTSVGPIDFPVDGRGVESIMTITAPDLTTNPAVYDFGPIKLPTSSADQVFSIANTGTFPFTLANVALDNNTDFTLTPPAAPLTLQPAESVNFTLVAHPSAVGTRNGIITIQTDIRGSNTTTFDLVVEGTSGSIELSDNNIDFGPVDVQGALPRTATITVTNPAATGTDVLEITGLSLTGDLAYQLVAGQQTSASLALGETFNITVEYTPIVESANDTATLSIFSDAANAAISQVAIAGRGIDRHIQVSAMTVSFPETLRNPDTPAQETVTVQNTGDAPLAISMLTTGGADAAAFSLNTTFMQVAPMSSQDLVIEFTPTAVNPSYSATITIINDDDQAPMVEITLTGAGVLPNVAMVASVPMPLLSTGQGVPLRLSDIAVGPIQLINMDPAIAFTVSDIRVTDAAGQPSDVFRVIAFEPDAQLAPGQPLDIDIELLSDIPGDYTGVVEVYIGTDPGRIAFTEIQGRVFELDVRGGCDVALSRTGSTDSTGRIGSLALMLLALALLLVMRASRRRGPTRGHTRGNTHGNTWARGLTSALIVFVVFWGLGTGAEVSAAHADNPYNIDLTTFRPAPGVESSMLSIENPAVGASGAWSLGLSVDHAVDPMVVRVADGMDTVDKPVAARTATNLMFSFAFLDRFEAGLTMPILQQSGDMPVASGIMPVNGTARGDLGVHLKAALLHTSMVSVAGSATVTAPTASDGMLAGVEGPSVHARGIAGLSLARLQVAANAGMMVRKRNKLGDVDQGNALTYGLAARYRVSNKLAAVAEFFGVLGLGAAERGAVSPAETAVGVRYRMNQSMSVNLGASFGLPAAGAGAASVRGIFMFSYTSGARELSPLSKPRRRITPTDKDGDGVADKLDQCPDEPEDEDLFEDSDGCAEWDNDEDGIDDGLDKCPLRPEDKDGFEDTDGCPDNDNDGDKIADADDKCPNVAEDLDGYEDLDGCDDPDNDRDGVPDVIDMCVLEPETINGNNDDDGCPDKGDSVVMLMADRLELFEPVHFKGNSSRLTPRSENVLAQVAATLRAQTGILKVRIGVHVHPANDQDKRRSRERAKTIHAWLIKWGIAPERLEIKEYGSEQPLVPRNQRGAKAINDRVEFIILEKAIE